MILGRQTITVINSGDVTSYDGTGKAVYGDPTLTTVMNCSVQEHRTTRDITLTDVVIGRWRIFAPPTAPLTTTSRVVLGSLTTWPAPEGTVIYLVDGAPAPWVAPSGIQDHIECYIKAQAG